MANTIYKAEDFALANPKKDIVVIYHAYCNDGFAGAWAAWKKFGSQAEYFPTQYNIPINSNFKNKTIYLIDFTFRGEELKNLIKNNKRIIILDHHISSKSAIISAPEYRYSDTHSGAWIAWNYFHPGTPTPRIIRYIEDIDLWKFKLPKTKEITAEFGITLTRESFIEMNKLSKVVESPVGRKKLAEKGSAILAYQEKKIKEIASRATPAILNGVRVGVVNSAMLKSEIGHQIMLNGYPAGVIWSDNGKRVDVSLRSDGKKMDVSKIAQKLGGGGHKAASGFSFPSDQKAPWRYTK
ncbi:MAG: DHHA1 domain-containing protein [Patescibacteria group bacterium]